MTERTIALRLCTTVGPSNEALRPFVRCPRNDSSVDALDCAGCLRMRSIEWSPEAGGDVRCLVESAATLDARADFAEIAARTPVHAIGDRVSSCATPDLPMERVRAMFANGCPLLPVVDEHGRLVAVISQASLADAPDAGFARDVMRPPTQVLPEDATVSAAVALFAVDDARAIPIVRADGTVTGLCRSGDIMRWVATRLGYSITPE